MKKFAFLSMVVLCSAIFCSCEKGNGLNPSFSQVEKYLFGTWRVAYYVYEDGEKEAETVETLYTFKSGSGYHEYTYTVTEAGQIGILNEKFVIEPMADNEKDDVVIYFPHDYNGEQYLITKINSSEMRWQEVTNYNPKTKTEAGYIFKRVE